VIFDGKAWCPAVVLRDATGGTDGGDLDSWICRHRFLRKEMEMRIVFFLGFLFYCCAVQAQTGILLVGDSFWNTQPEWQPISDCLVNKGIPHQIYPEAVGSRFLTQTDISNWVSTYQPDVVAVQLGVNDVVHDIPPSQILAVADQMLQAATSADRVLFAAVTPFTVGLPSVRTQSDLDRAADYNGQLAGWVNSQDIPSRLGFVDNWAAWNGSPDGMVVSDGLHPNTAGIAALSQSWCSMLAATIDPFAGDANQDGHFNSSDLVQVFSEGLYETGLPAVWQQGDWDGNGLFATGDMVLAFGTGMYEETAADAIVPEPSAMILFLFGFLFYKYGGLIK